MRRLALLATLALAGCGGGTVTTSATTTVAVEPIPSATAQQLAGEADAVAADLDRNDGCTAQQDAVTLRTDAIAAINAHQVPGPYQEELLGRVQSLEAQIQCAPPAPAQPHDSRKHDKPKHDHGGGQG